MIQICNWLITRKCNLKCNYCMIVKNYEGMPYKRMSDYKDYQMSTLEIIENLNILKKHNPNMFHIFYGSEPFLRDDLLEIITHCNKNNIFYTIISNNSDGIEHKINNLFENCEVRGFTSSVDPVYEETGLDDSLVKSRAALIKLKKIKAKYPNTDVVAEITITSKNVKNLYRLVSELAESDIHSSITCIDPAKNKYYDFSNIFDNALLVESHMIKDQIDLIQNDDKIKNYIHMRDDLLPMLVKSLPSDFDCKMEENIHNMTVDADGTVRLCLRIKGVETAYLKVRDCFDENYEISDDYRYSISTDKKKYCDKCNWTCTMMTKIVDENSSKMKNLLHIS